MKQLINVDTEATRIKVHKEILEKMNNFRKQGGHTMYMSTPNKHPRSHSRNPK